MSNVSFLYVKSKLQNSMSYTFKYGDSCEHRILTVVDFRSMRLLYYIQIQQSWKSRAFSTAADSQFA